MTDPAPPRLPSAETNGQLIVSLAIVAIMGSLGLALVVAGVLTGKWEVLATGIGSVIGGLGTALNAPSGISNVLRANNAKPPEGT